MRDGSNFERCADSFILTTSAAGYILAALADTGNRGHAQRRAPSIKAVLLPSGQDHIPNFLWKTSMSTQPSTSAEKSSSENLNRPAGPRAVAAAAGIRQLNPRLDKMIAAYATAASAVGLALLAAAQPAEGKIVYTKT